MDNTARKVLVVGATGALGRPVVAGLRRRGVARILGLQALADSALPERFDGAAALQARYGIRLTTLEDFVQQRVAAAREG